MSCNEVISTETINTVTVTPVENTVVSSEASNSVVEVCCEDDQIISSENVIETAEVSTTLNVVTEETEREVIESTCGGGGGTGTTSVLIGTVQSGENISALRVVSADPADGKVYYTDNTELASAETAIGISLTAALADAELQVVQEGAFEDAGWSWNTAGNPALFVTTNGVITQTPPTSGFTQKVGFIITATKIYVKIETPIYLT